MKNLIFRSLIICTLVSCNQETTPKQIKNDFIGLDSTIRPGDNFFEYVNKTWYDKATIADDQVGVGSYSFLNIPQKMLLQDILDEVSTSLRQEGSIEQKVGDFYASGMDTAAINSRGFEPIQPILDKINAANNVAALMTFIADELKSAHTSVISMGVSPDNENSKVNMLHFSQSGLGLPDRDYYFKTDSATLAIQKAYKKYITTLFQLTGHKDAPKLASKVYDIEKQLAASHKTRIERRDIKANFNKLSVADLNKKQANIGWTDFMKNLNLAVDSVDIGQLAYYDKLNEMLKSVALADWKTFLKASTMATYAKVLSSPFEMASFEYNKVVQGQSVQKTRAQLMVAQVDSELGFALGKLYVKRYFNEAAKQRVLNMVNNIQKSFENRINQLDWMSDSTKQKAIEKLYAISKKIGYPDVWREYNVKMTADKYFENVVALRQNDYQYEMEKLKHAPNKEEWFTTPPTVTAYYDPSTNQIVIPAGILQFPYFDEQADDAVNYGGIGMVIGHELTHAFDDQGAQYDKEGNVKDWWTKQDYEKFEVKTQQMIDRYSSFTVLDSIHVKGGLTVGENTADNGGIAIAYDAFKMTPEGKSTTKVGGFTPDQWFFLSIARIWRVKTRDEFMRNYVHTNPHSPAMWRVNGPLMNFTPFYNAFDVQPGDKNYRPEEERIKIW